MLKLFIVDDDTLQRNALKTQYDWNMLGVEIVGEAWNGQEALESFVLLKPDIIIADIKMPIMDGVEMARQIMRIAPKTKIILCSGYDDFEYAKEAVNLGVSAYVLKPIQDEELLHKVKAAIEKRIEDNLKDLTLEKLKNKNMLTLPIARENIMKEIILGQSEIDTDILIDLDLKWVFQEKNDLNMILIILNNENCQRCSKLKKQLDRYFFRYILVKISAGELAIVFLAKVNKENQGGYMEEKCQQISDDFFNIYGEKIMVNYSTSLGQDDYIHEMYEHVKKKLDIVQAKDIIHKLSEKKDIKEHPLEMIELELNKMNKIKSQFKKDMSNFMRHSDMEGIKNSIKRLFKDLLQEHSTSIEFIEVGLFIFSVIASEERKLGQRSIGDVDKDINNWIHLLSYKNLNEIQNYLISYAEDINNAHDLNNQDKTEIIIWQIDEIIEKKFNEQISVEYIAKKLHFSPNYLGTVFKSRKGVNLSEYINKYRILKAIEKLNYNESTVKDVALSCGFENVSYFHTLFRKYTGLTPNQYRKKIIVEGCVKSD